MLPQVQVQQIQQNKQKSQKGQKQHNNNIHNNTIANVSLPPQLPMSPPKPECKKILTKLAVDLSMCNLLNFY